MGYSRTLLNSRLGWNVVDVRLLAVIMVAGPSVIWSPFEDTIINDGQISV